MYKYSDHEYYTIFPEASSLQSTILTKIKTKKLKFWIHETWYRYNDNLVVHVSSVYPGESGRRGSRPRCFLRSRFQSRPTLRWNVVYHRIWRTAVIWTYIESNRLCQKPSSLKQAVAMVTGIFFFIWVDILWKRLLQVPGDQGMRRGQCSTGQPGYVWGGGVLCSRLTYTRALLFRSPGMQDYQLCSLLDLALRYLGDKWCCNDQRRSQRH